MKYFFNYIIILFLLSASFPANATQTVLPAYQTPTGTSPIIVSPTTPLPIRAYDSSSTAGSCLVSNGTYFVPGSCAGTAGVASINSVTGAFTFTGSGVTCTSTTCTFSGGGGGSVSVTAGTPDVVITPTPGTGTFTVGTTELINAQGTAATYTIQATDMGKTVTHSRSTAVAVTLPVATTTGYGAGTSFTDINLGTGNVVITPTTSTINGASSLTLAQNQSAYIISDGTNYVSFQGAPASGGSVTWPTSGDIVVSNGTNSPPGIPETDGNCVTGVSGAWASGSCSGTSNITLGTSGAATNPQRSGEATTGFYSLATGELDMGVVTTGLIEKITGSGVTVQATNANALTVAQSGTTNPALEVDTSTTSSVNGLDIKASTSGNKIALNAISSATNEGMVLNTKGNGDLNLNSNGGSVTLQESGASIIKMAAPGAALQFTPNTGNNVHFQMTAPADTNITAATEFNIEQFNNLVTRQHATGALALQRDFFVSSATNSFVGASTATNLATMGFQLPGCGTNCTATNVSGIYHASTALVTTGPITNSFAINVAADTGASNNFAAQLDGPINLLNQTTGTNADFLCLSSSGQILVQTTACTISERRLKENFAFINGHTAIQDLMALSPIEFNFKSTTPANPDPNTTKTQYGFIADEVASVDPKLAIYENDLITPKSYRQESIIALLVKGMQEQQAEIEALKFGLHTHQCYLFFRCENEK